jgi:hypothetical protein
MEKSPVLMRIVSAVLLCFFIAACAPSAKKVQASYVSPLQYQIYSCDQLQQEYIRVSQRVKEVSGQQDNAAGKDTAALMVGVMVFWPAVFLMIGGDKKEELSRLKGEAEAVEISAIQKNCALAAQIADARRHQQELEAEKKAKKAEEMNTLGPSYSRSSE